MSFQEYAQSARSRFRLGDVNPKLAAGVVAVGVVVVIAIAIGAAALIFVDGGAEDDNGSFAIEAASDVKSSSAADAADGSEAAEAQAASVCVYVSGCVANPGICYLDEGARVADAIGAAGGMTAEAAADSLNLARVVVDGEQIDVISAEEAAAAVAAGSATLGGASAGSAASGTSSTSTSGNGKVNINTATSQELQTLSGIGESKAGKIIAYREANGAFSSVDELTKVSGIGDKTLESIRDAICV